MKRIVTVLGTRPEIIKLSSLLNILNKKFENIIIYTSQHYDYFMGYKFFEELELPKPEYDLKLGKKHSHKQISIMIEKIGDILIKEKPECVIVLGDTNTVLAGALAAVKLNIKVAHVESGCRSFNKKAPEEINRILVDRVADFLFVPDKVSLKNLEKEGITKNTFLVGSTVFDSTLRNLEYSKKSNIMRRLNLKPKNFCLVTIHRAENTDDIDVITNIIDGINKIADKIDLVFPIHPRTNDVIRRNNIKINSRIKVSEPLPYLDFLNILSNSFLILTDSGGVQEEALICNVPCLILRTETEWTRIVELGKNFLVGVKSKDIENTFLDLYTNKNKYNKILNIKAEFSENVSEKIMDILSQNL